MNKEEFIGKLQMVYVGDKNASTDIIKEYDRLNNIINELEKFMDKDYKELDKYGLGAPAGSAMGEINRIKGKLQELKDSD